MFEWLCSRRCSLSCQELLHPATTNSLFPSLFCALTDVSLSGAHYLFCFFFIWAPVIDDTTGATLWQTSGPWPQHLSSLFFSFSCLWRWTDALKIHRLFICAQVTAAAAAVVCRRCGLEPGGVQLRHGFFNLMHYLKKEKRKEIT